VDGSAALESFCAGMARRRRRKSLDDDPCVIATARSLGQKWKAFEFFGRKGQSPRADELEMRMSEIAAEENVTMSNELANDADRKAERVREMADRVGNPYAVLAAIADTLGEGLGIIPDG
jgi:hypothetical protein